MTVGSKRKAESGTRRAKSKGKTQMSKIKSATIPVWWSLFSLLYFEVEKIPDNEAAREMTTEAELGEKLRKIYALFEGATTPGERDAAAAAINRVKAALAIEQKREKLVEMRFSLPDRWQRRLFTALCRRYGVEPYRYRGQRYSSLMVRVPRSFIDGVLWPEFLEIKQVLDEYLNEATERIIREEVYQNAGEPQERTG